MGNVKNGTPKKSGFQATLDNKNKMAVSSNVTNIFE